MQAAGAEQSVQANAALPSDPSPYPPSSTDLLQLPQDLLGLIYASIHDSQKRRAFFHSCKATRTAEAILSQISSLEVDPEAQDLALVCFPKGACMRSLTLGVTSRNMSSTAFARLLQALQDPSLHTGILHTVSSLSLKELPLFMSAKDSALLGAACARMESLVSLELDAAPVFTTFFQELLKSPHTTHGLQCLHVRDPICSAEGSRCVRPGVLPHIAQFSGLQVLSIQRQSLSRVDVSNLASLSNLRELDLLHPASSGVEGLHEVFQSCTQLWKLKVTNLYNCTREPGAFWSSSLRVLALTSCGVEDLPLLFTAFPSLQELSIQSHLSVDIPSQEKGAELAERLTRAVSCSGRNIDSLRGLLGVPLPDEAAPSQPGDHSLCLEGGGESQDVRALVQCFAPLAGAPLMRTLRRLMLQGLTFTPGAMSDLSTVWTDVETLEIGASNVLCESSFVEAVLGFKELREITLGVDCFNDDDDGDDDDDDDVDSSIDDADSFDELKKAFDDEGFDNGVEGLSDDVQGFFEGLKKRVISACCEAQNQKRILVFTLLVHSGFGSLHRSDLIYSKVVDIANAWYLIASARHSPPIKAHVKVLKTHYGDLF